MKHFYVTTTKVIFGPKILAGRVVFHIPDWLHHLLMGGRILFKNTLEAYTDYYLQNKLDQVFQEHRVVSLITLLRGNEYYTQKVGLSSVIK